MIRRVLATVPLRQVDGRSEAAVFLRRTRADLVEQLGGEDQVTPAQLLLVEELCKSVLILKAIGQFIMRQDTLVRRGAILPVILQREVILANVARVLKLLGVKNHNAKTLTLDDYLATKAKAATARS